LVVGGETVIPGIDYLPDVYEALEEVEDRLIEATKVPDPYFAEVTAYLARAGGKRVRPLLALLGARVGGPIAEPAIDAAVAVELIHVGSLHHDDVIDESPTRRGRPSVNVTWGNSIAILAGDLVLARASEIGARLGRKASEMLARTLGTIVYGQMLELAGAYDLNSKPERYWRVIENKTASLIATSVALGGHVAGLGAREVEALELYGHHMGMAFQIADDVLDIVGRSERLGKPVGLDMIEGTYTLPVIYGLESERGEELAALLRKIKEVKDSVDLVVSNRHGHAEYVLPESITEAVADARTLLIECGAVESALGDARRELDSALRHLRELGDAPALEALATVGRYIIDRITADEGISPSTA
jgi:heptaprenyl diphosphate synthase